MGLNTVYPLPIEINRLVGSFLLYPEKKSRTEALLLHSIDIKTSKYCGRLMGFGYGNMCA